MDNDPNQTSDMPESPVQPETPVPTPVDTPIQPASTPADSPSILSKQPKSTNYSLIVAGLFVLTFAVPGLGFFTIPTFVYFLFMSAKKPEIGYRQAGTDNAGRQLYVSEEYKETPLYTIFKIFKTLASIVAIGAIAIVAFIIYMAANSEPSS